MEEKTFEQISQVKDLNIKDLLPIDIDGVTIEVRDNKRQIYLPAIMNGERFVTWKKKRGGIFYKDVFLYLNGHPTGKYVEASGENILLVLRIIEDDELELFQLKRLVHGKVKDQHVMVLKNLLETGKQEEDYEYNKEINLDEAEEETEGPIPIQNPDIPLEDEEEANSSRSLSLFD